MWSMELSLWISFYDMMRIEHLLFNLSLSLAHSLSRWIILVVIERTQALKMWVSRWFFDSLSINQSLFLSVSLLLFIKTHPLVCPSEADHDHCHCYTTWGSDCKGYWKKRRKEQPEIAIHTWESIRNARETGIRKVMQICKAHFWIATIVPVLTPVQKAERACNKIWGGIGSVSRAKRLPR